MDPEHGSPEDERLKALFDRHHTPTPRTAEAWRADEACLRERLPTEGPARGRSWWFPAQVGVAAAAALTLAVWTGLPRDPAVDPEDAALRAAWERSIWFPLEATTDAERFGDALFLDELRLLDLSLEGRS